MYMPRLLRSALLLCLFLLTLAPARGAEPGEIRITAANGTELTLLRHAAEGEFLVLWVGGSGGLTERGRLVGQALAGMGIEVWQIDFAETLFQMGGSNFLRNLDPHYLVELIEIAHARSGKKIVLFSRGYGAIPVLRAATLWQLASDTRAHLSGVILVSPDLLAGVPELGMEPEYLPISRATNIPLMIMQAGQRSNRSYFPRLLEQLRSRNPNVYYSFMPGVAGLFYHGDTSPATLAKLARLPAELPGVIRLLDATPRDNIAPAYTPPGKITARLDSVLKPYRASPIPTPINLQDAEGKQFVLKDYTGRITVVNFWASWCPPCVEEIPSLNRLIEKMRGNPFELVSINYAESPETIAAFLKQVRVDFPVLLDRDASVATQWNVIAFPSTFVIGPDGKIRYGVNAAISWDSQDVVNKLNRLLEK